MKILLPTSLEVSVEVSKAPAIALPADPEPNGALIQVATIGKLIDREVIWILATPAVVLPSGHHFTRN